MDGVRAIAPESTLRPEARVLVDVDGTVGAWDEAARQMFGSSPEEVLGRPFSALFDGGYPDDGASLTRAARAHPLRLLATGKCKDGARFEAEITCTRAPPAYGASAGLVEMVRDVTEQRAIEEAVTAVSGALGGSAALDALARSLERWIPFAGLSLGVIEGRRYRRIMHAGVTAMKVLDRHGLRPGAGAVHEAVTCRAQTTVRDTRSGGFPPDASLAALGIGSYVVTPMLAGTNVVAVLNVAFRRPDAPSVRNARLLAAVAAAVAIPLEATLEFERESLALSRQRQRVEIQEEILAGAAHNMQTPLAVIAGIASSLREQWDVLADKEKLEDLAVVVRNCEGLARIVEQDVQVALIDGRKLSYDFRSFDLLRQVEAVIQGLASADRKRVSVGIGEQLPLVHGDEQRTRQVLGNLLSNALKFSPTAASVELSVARRGPMAEVLVRDHGVGIAAGNLPELFRKFSCVGTAGPRGSGLGLYLSRKMAEAQGGWISVESRVGEGSVFSYTLPLSLP